MKRALIVNATAGSGKTTTIVDGLSMVAGKKQLKYKPSEEQLAIWNWLKAELTSEDEVVVCAFSNAIATELKERLTFGTATTIHSLGCRIMRENGIRIGRPDTWKTANLYQQFCQVKSVKELSKAQRAILDDVRELVKYCKDAVLTEDDITESSLAGLAIDNEYTFSSSASACELPVKYVLEEGSTLPVREERRASAFGKAKPVKGMEIDFDDMIYLPARYGWKIKADCIVVDECLPGWTPVMLGAGGSKPIQDIKIGDVVRSFDVTTGRAKNCKVTATQKIPNRKPLVKVKVQHNHRTDGKYAYNFVVCTIDHKIWTVNNGWVYAGDLKVGETVIVETAAETTQKGKISAAGRDKLSQIHQGNTKGIGNVGGDREAFNAIKGGNGRGPTEPQKLLFDALGDGWYMEYVIKTGDAPNHGRGNKPTHYKIDLANPKYRIAVEIDGASHAGTKEIDDKKDQFLESQGWKVLRFKNRDIARDFAGVLQDICPDGKNCPMPATVISVDSTYISENYVYDITVKDCHNFYANGVLVHNCQDLSAGKLQLIANQDCTSFVFVGDPNQAIFAFAGAQTDSFSKIAEAMDEVEVLPLSYTYRCGKAIVAEAQKIVGDAINAGSTNPDGEIVYLDEADMDLQQGDMLVSRVNAPLMSLAWKLVKAGKPCQVVGRSIGAGLVKLINKLTDKQEVDSVTLCQLLEDWRDQQIKLLQTKKYDTESRQIAIGDQADCITTVATNCKTSTEVVSFIQQIFNDSDVKSIRLSSIHRAKGLEADNVYFFNPKNVPHVLAKTAEAKKQEWNLKFVAITRAIHKLVYVRIPEKEVEV
jgi:hypothetical protein